MNMYISYSIKKKKSLFLYYILSFPVSSGEILPIILNSTDSFIVDSIFRISRNLLWGEIQEILLGACASFSNGGILPSELKRKGRALSIV